MYSMILPVANAKVFVDQIFRIFDKDGNGDIDFKVNYTVLQWFFNFLTILPILDILKNQITPTI